MCFIKILSKSIKIEESTESFQITLLSYGVYKYTTVWKQTLLHQTLISPASFQIPRALKYVVQHKKPVNKHNTYKQKWCHVILLHSS